MRRFTQPVTLPGISAMKHSEQRRKNIIHAGLLIGLRA